MIRHSSSFFLSLLLHIAILAVVFFIYKGVSSIEKPKVEKKICVKLCTLKKEKKISKPKPKAKIKKIVKSKPIVKKPKKKKLVKLKPKKVKKFKPKPKKIKKKPKPKPKPKKIVKVIKKKPVVVEEIKEVKPEPKVEPLVYTEVVKEKYVQPKEEEVYDEIKNETEAVEIQNEEQRVEELTDEYIDNHEDEIRQLINDNLYYPRRARKRGVQGDVKVRFTLSRDAKISDIKVISSKSDILTRAAIKTLQNLYGKFPKPSETLIINIPIKYRLR